MLVSWEGTAVYRGGGRGLQSIEEGGGDCSLQRRGEGTAVYRGGGGDCSLQRRGEGTALHVTVEQHMLRALLLHCTVTFCKCPWALTMHVAARGGWALTVCLTGKTMSILCDTIVLITDDIKNPRQGLPELA